MDYIERCFKLETENAHLKYEREKLIALRDHVMRLSVLVPSKEWTDNAVNLAQSAFRASLPPTGSP